MKKISFFVILSFCYFALVQCNSADPCDKTNIYVQRAEALLKQSQPNVEKAFLNYSMALLTRDLECNYTETLDKSKGQFKELANVKKLNFSGLFMPKEKGVFKELTNLQELNLSSTHLIHFPPFLKDLSSLQKLNLSSNHISNDDSKTLPKLINLQELDLSSNKLFSFDSSEYLSDPLILKNLTKLENLNLSFNDLNNLGKDAFSNLNNLQKLNLSHNNLTALDKSQFKGLTNLKELLLGVNSLETLDKELFVGLNKLQKLSLSSTLIKELGGLNNLPALELLDLQGCMRLSKLPNEIEQLKKLRYVFVYGSNLSAEEITRIQKLIPWAKIVTEKDSQWEAK